MLVIAMVLIASAAGANGLLGGVSFSLWSDRDTTARAGANQLVTFSDSAGGPTSGFYKAGFLVVPTDRYGVFADLSYLRIDPLIMGIKPEFLQKMQTWVDGNGGVSFDDGSIVVSVRSLPPDLYDMVTSVTQNQGRHDESGLIPKFLQLFGRKTHHQITSTDTVGATFGVVDASEYIADYGRLVLGVNDPTTFTPEQIRLVRSAFFDSRLKGVIEFSSPLLDYSLMSQGIAMREHGLPAPLDPPTQIAVASAPATANAGPPAPTACPTPTQETGSAALAPNPAPIRFFLDNVEVASWISTKPGERLTIMAKTVAGSVEYSITGGGKTANGQTTTPGTTVFPIVAPSGDTVLTVRLGQDTGTLTIKGVE
jgi:hypothetical protein